MKKYKGWIDEVVSLSGVDLFYKLFPVDFLSFNKLTNQI